MSDIIVSKKVEGSLALRYLEQRIPSELTGFTGKTVNKLVEADLGIAIEKAMCESMVRVNNGSLMIFNGKSYVEFNNSELRGFLSHLLGKSGVGSIYRFNSARAIAAYLECSILIPTYNPSKEIISFNNTVLTLCDMKTHNHDQKWETNIHLDFDYDPKAKCDRFRQYLTDVLPNEDVQKVLQEFLGLIFVDRSKYNVEASLYLLGKGGNGKGVIYELINQILGKDNVSAYSMYDLTEHNNADYKIAEANGKLLNFCADMEDKDFSGGKYKAISSGEAVMARAPGKEPFKATQMPLLAANVNKLPITRDTSDGYYRRNKIIPFDRQFTEETADKTLKFKLRQEIPGIFNWIMEGRKRIMDQEGNFTRSEIIDKAARKAKVESNSSLLFMEYMGYFTEMAEGRYQVQVKASDLFREYTEFCNDSGYARKGQNKFGNDLVNDGAQKGSGRSAYTYYLYKQADDYVAPNDKDVAPNDKDVDKKEVQNSLPF